MEKKITFSLFILIILSLSNIRAQSMTSDKALTIANEYAKQFGFLADSCNVEFKNNTLTVKTLKKDNFFWRVSTPTTKSILKILKGHKFWYIYYTKKHGGMGNDLQIFVDSKSGKVLAHVLGE